MKKIFLTGASSGIGKAIAIALAEEGHQVWGTSRDIARLSQLTNVHPLALDLGDSISIANAFAAAVRDAGKIDVLINNAGSGHFGPAENLSAETISNQFQLLVFGHIQLMQLALAAMRDQGGLIINNGRVHDVDPTRTARFQSAHCRSSTGRHLHKLQ